MGCYRKGSEKKVEVGILHLLKLYTTGDLEINGIKENEQESLRIWGRMLGT